MHCEPKCLATSEMKSGRAVAAGGAEGATTLGRTLRELVAEDPAEASSEVDALIAECDALRFAPAGESADLPPELVSRARQLLETRGGQS